MPDAFERLATKYAAFVEERDWEQFHTPQNLAMALSVEANELLEQVLRNPEASNADIAATTDTRWFSPTSAF